jgi:beta-lactam-binding protein with PASTA domain
MCPHDTRSARVTPTSRSPRLADLTRIVATVLVAVAVGSLLLLTACSGAGGSSSKTVRVPDVTGMDWAEAQTLLSGAKLSPVIDARKVPGAKALTVISQKPAPRTDVPEGTRITLVIVSGSTPATKAP